jgi:hypothetical protein
MKIRRYIVYGYRHPFGHRIVHTNSKFVAWMAKIFSRLLYGRVEVIDTKRGWLISA